MTLDNLKRPFYGLAFHHIVVTVNCWTVMAKGCVYWFLWIWRYVFSKLTITVNKLISTPALHSGGAGFKSRAGDRLWGREFLWFSSVSPRTSTQISLWLLSAFFCVRRSLLVLTSDVTWCELLATSTNKGSKKMKCFLSKPWRLAAGVEVLCYLH